MPVIVAAIAAAIVLIVTIMEKHTTAAELPADPAGRRAVVNGVIGRRAPNVGALHVCLRDVSALETANYKSAALGVTNSLFNRHVGSGRGAWNGKVYDTGTRQVYVNAYARAQHLRELGRDIYASEDLRCYDSLDQSVDDILQLLAADGLYSEAWAYATSGQPERFFEALAKGNGKEGFVGNPKAPKAASYVLGLMRTHAAGGIA